MSSFESNLTEEVASLVHKERPYQAAMVLRDALKLSIKLENDPAKYYPPLIEYLHHLLNSGLPASAAKILWTSTQFTPEPQCTKDVWELFETSSQGLIMGSGSMSKSYGMGVRLFLEYIRDPEFTTIKVIGPSEDHLETNLFSHITGLHRTAKLPMPGEVGELFIGLSRRDQLSSIKGVVIPVGKVKKAGRIQGAKRRSRPTPHKLFGALSRLFIFMDEVENIPGGIWSDVDNILSNIDEEGTVSGFKIFGAYNPSDQTLEVGKRAEPPFGWNAFDMEKHFKWKSTRGWDVLRLDGERCENVVQGKVIYPGLQTRAGLEAIARNSGGRQSAGYFTMGRGAYPPSGVELTIIPPGLLAKMRGKFIWYESPTPVGAADLALEGGANAVFTLGKWGRASGILFPPSLEHPLGRRYLFKDRMGQSIIRWGLQAEQQLIVPRGETVHMKDSLIGLCRKAGIKGEFFACDRTGGGSGVADLMRYEWSPSIHDVNYSEGCSNTKIMLEDRKTCDEELERLASELWFAMKAWGEFNYLLISPEFDMTKITQQLTQRKFRTTGLRTKVEAKKDYMSRGFESPDEADSLTLLVHAARKGSGVTLSMKLDETSDMPGSEDFDGWEDEMKLRGGARIDATNTTQFLDDGARPYHAVEDVLL